MIAPRDPAAMSVAEVQGELAAILARGWWRRFINQKSHKALDDRVAVEPSCEQWPPVDGQPHTHEETT